MYHPLIHSLLSELPWCLPHSWITCRISGTLNKFLLAFEGSKRKCFHLCSLNVFRELNNYVILLYQSVWSWLDTNSWKTIIYLIEWLCPLFHLLSVRCHGMGHTKNSSEIFQSRQTNLPCVTKLETSSLFHTLLLPYWAVWHRSLSASANVSKHGSVQ